MFKYRLEPILTLKEKLEDSKKRELGLAYQSYEQVNAEKEELVKAKEQAYEEVKNQSHEKIDVQQLKQFRYYMHYMNQAIDLKTKEVERAANILEAKREALIAAVKERKILENLKDIHLEEYREEEKRKENSVLDEIVTYKYNSSEKE